MLFSQKAMEKIYLLVFFSDQQTNQTDELWSRQTTMKYPMFLVFTGLVAMGKGIFLIIVIGVLLKISIVSSVYYWIYKKTWYQSHQWAGEQGWAWQDPYQTSGKKVWKSILSFFSLSGIYVLSLRRPKTLYNPW